MCLSQVAKAHHAIAFLMIKSFTNPESSTGYLMLARSFNGQLIIIGTGHICSILASKVFQNMGFPVVGRGVE